MEGVKILFIGYELEVGNVWTGWWASGRAELSGEYR